MSHLRRVFLDMNGGGGGSYTLRQKMARGQYGLYCVLIYSDLDRAFVDFLEETHESLSVMSGEHVFVFWFDHFASDSLILWSSNDLPSNRRTVRRSESLRLARALGIPMSETPCLLLCNELEAENGVVYSFSNSWSPSQMSEHFKAVFDIAESTLRQSNGGSAISYDDMRKRLNRLKIKKWVKGVTTNQSFGNLLRAIATGDKLAL